MTTEEIAEILRLHKLWLEGRPDGKRADLRGANLRGANLDSADLSSADLCGANLDSANLTSADLCGANLRGANLDSANLSSADLRGANLRGANLDSANLSSADLCGANLRGANLDSANLDSADLRGAGLTSADLRSAWLSTGEKFDQYLSEVVPSLLTAGGKSLDEIAASGAWDCHDWSNCPMHVAFGIASESEGPPLLVPRIRQFVQLFDAKMIPAPVRDKSGRWVFRLPEPVAESN